MGLRSGSDGVVLLVLVVMIATLAPAVRAPALSGVVEGCCSSAANTIASRAVVPVQPAVTPIPVLRQLIRVWAVEGRSMTRPP